MNSTSGKSHLISGERTIRGSVRTLNGKGVVRVEDRFDTDIEDLWSALTEPHRLANWIGEVEGDLRPDGVFRAHFFASGWVGTGRVVVCERPQRLRVLTKGDDEPDEHILEATLTASARHTTLVIEESGISPQQTAAYGAGLQVHVEDLAAYLAGRERGDGQKRWAERFPTWQDLAAHNG